MTPLEAFESVATSLVGMPISHIWRGYGSAMFLEFGTLKPIPNRDGSPGHPEGEISLGVEWSWRIEDATSIVCGTWSKEKRWEPSFDSMRNSRLVGCELFGALPEVAITTDGGFRFLSFSTTDGQPQWHLVDRRADVPRWFTVRHGRLHLGDGSEPAY